MYKMASSARLIRNINQTIQIEGFKHNFYCIVETLMFLEYRRCFSVEFLCNDIQS